MLGRDIIIITLLTIPVPVTDIYSYCVFKKSWSCYFTYLCGYGSVSTFLLVLAWLLWWYPSVSNWMLCYVVMLLLFHSFPSRPYKMKWSVSFVSVCLLWYYYEGMGWDYWDEMRMRLNMRQIGKGSNEMNQTRKKLTLFLILSYLFCIEVWLEMRRR